MRQARLRLGQPLDVDLLDLARDASLAPDELERRLLLWHDQGLLRYDGSARDALLHLLPAPADAGSRIDDLLAEYAARQDARIDAIGAYARQANCRHRTIAAHFGERLTRCGSACDICAPDTTADRSFGSAQGRRPPTTDRRKARYATHNTRHTMPTKHLAAHDIDSAILACLTHLPFQVGRTGLAKVLKGAAKHP